LQELNIYVFYLHNIIFIISAIIMFIVNNFAKRFEVISSEDIICFSLWGVVTSAMFLFWLQK